MGKISIHNEDWLVCNGKYIPMQDAECVLGSYLAVVKPADVAKLWLSRLPEEVVLALRELWAAHQQKLSRGAAVHLCREELKADGVPGEIANLVAMDLCK